LATPRAVAISFDRDYSACHPDDRNGYVFHQPGNPGAGIRDARAIGL